VGTGDFVLGEAVSPVLIFLIVIAIVVMLIVVADLSFGLPGPRRRRPRKRFGPEHTMLGVPDDAGAGCMHEGRERRGAGRPTWVTGAGAPESACT
jgi:hypothetical protein